MNALTALRAVLPSTAEMKVIKQNGPMALVKIAAHRAQVLWVGEGWSAQVKPALKSVNSKYPAIFVARKMSPGVQELLRDQHIHWADETGAAEIAIGSVVVSRTGQHISHSTKTERWTPAVLSVAEALLCNCKATVSSISEITHLSTGSCINALRFLAEQAYLTSKQVRGRESARSVANHEKLLEDYASQASLFPAKASLSIGVSWKDPANELAKIGKKWTQSKLQWATTGELAGNILAPLITQVATYEVYIHVKTIAELEALSRQFELRPVQGGRLILKTAPTKLSDKLTMKKEGLIIAPWPRVYADLRSTGVRGENAAEHLKEVMNERRT